MSEQLDHPLMEVARAAEQEVLAGHTVHQKFTCGGCGVRQTIEEPNRFYTQGRCEECGHVTDLQIAGCNYLVIRDLC